MRLDKGVEFVSDNKVLLFFRRNPIRASRQKFVKTAFVAKKKRLLPSDRKIGIAIGILNGLSEKIWTSGLLNPIQARYQTALHPVTFFGLLLYHKVILNASDFSKIIAVRTGKYFFCPPYAKRLRRKQTIFLQALKMAEMRL